MAKRKTRRSFTRDKAGLDNSAPAYQVRVVPELAKAISLAAAENYEIPTQWIRRIIVERLRADGKL